MSTSTPKPGQLRGTSPLRPGAPRLIRGQGRFVDDIRLPGMLHAAVLRSPVAHATLRTLDLSATAKMTGVHAVLGPDEVGARTTPMAVPILAKVQQQRSVPILTADGRLRYVGEPIAIVAADTRARAEDATESIVFEFDPLPAVTDVDRALAPDASLLYPDWGSNVAFELAAGGDPDAVIAAAPVVIEQQFDVGRVAPSPMEGRGAVASIDPGTGDLTLWTSTQSPQYVRQVCAEVLGLPQSRIRVIVPDMGGGFGQKDHPYPEEMLVCLLAMACGRPVKWIEDRRENLISSNHAREQRHRVRLASDAEGRILAMSTAIQIDAGANLHARGPGPANLSTTAMPGPYRFASFSAQTKGIVTNKTPFGAYRGYGHPEAVFVMERAVDMLAARLGLDPAEVRFRNLVTPDQMPFTSAAGRAYDSGDYPEALRRVMTLIDHDHWRREQRRARDEGRYVGVGVAINVESTGLGPVAVVERQGWRVGGYETAIVQLMPDGTATVRMALPSCGQGMEVALAQLVGDELRIGIDDVNVILNDTAQTPFSGLGTVASRGTAVGGSAVVRAARGIRTKLVAVAAQELGVEVEDIELGDGGRLCVRGSDKGMLVTDAATLIQRGIRLPQGVTPGLEVTAIFQPLSIPFSYTSQAAVVEVDPETGFVQILSYAAVDDCGTVVNPAEVDAQLVGAIAQGIGEALYEELVYDDDGQLLNASFMDYLIPTVAEVPAISLGHLEIPSPHTEHGVKGVGEAGIVAVMAVLGNAISDALAPFGVQVTRMPASPGYIRSLIREAAAPAVASSGLLTHR
jgi:carbon-monoxide dehydrogenase large subunit